jgi:hypothetical protein
MNLQEKALADMNRINQQLILDLDKANMINGAVLAAISEKGSLTKADYNLIYAQTLAAWQAKHAAPNN